VRCAHSLDLPMTKTEQRRAAQLVASGVQFVALLALSDEGAPRFNAPLAAELARLGVPGFACTPDQFPELMAAVIQRRDLRDWVVKEVSASHR
jgi:hypothetical protein